jgi:hypothetical protein
MFGRAGRNAIIDLLFILLLSFVALFFLAFTMAAAKQKEEATEANDNNILITMRWQKDNDIDLWLRLPDKRKVWYQNRDEPPAHLDVDVVCWRKFKNDLGIEVAIEDSEEIITIRSVLAGEYAVNVHYYSAQGLSVETQVKIMVQDVKNKRILYYGEKTLERVWEETPFVKFTVADKGKGKYWVEKVYTDRPEFFVNAQPPDRSTDDMGQEDDYNPEESD